MYPNTLPPQAPVGMPPEPVMPIPPISPTADSSGVNNASPKSSPLTSIAWVLIGVAVLALAAYFAGTKYLGSQKPAATPTAMASPTPSATPDPTASWEAYTNKEKGYLVKYPKAGFLRFICPDEELTVTDRNIGNQTSPVVMETCGRGNRYTLETKTFDSIQPEPKETEFYSVTKKDILLADLPATQYFYTYKNTAIGPFPQWYTIARVNKNNKTYEIYFDEKDKLDLFGQILSTFKFIQ